MTDNNKIPLDAIAVELTRQIGKEYSYNDVLNAAAGWVKHPKFPSCTRQTMYERDHNAKTRAFITESELYSFQQYIGYPLMHLLDVEDVENFEDVEDVD